MELLDQTLVKLVFVTGTTGSTSLHNLIQVISLDVYFQYTYSSFKNIQGTDGIVDISIR